MPEINELAPLDQLEQMSRRDRKKQETRWRIYRAAMALIGKKGYDAVTIEDICETADVSNASFFHHFTSKAALIIAYWDEMKAEIRGALDDAGDASCTEKLAIINRAASRAVSDTASFTPQLLSVIASGDKTLDMEHIDTGITSTLTGIIREGQAAGEFSTRWHPEIVAVSLTAAWLLMPLAMRSPAFPSDPHQELMELILAGLAVDSA